MWFRRLRCSFCRRSNKDVTKLVAGADICDKCAYETIRIMEATPPAESPTGRACHRGAQTRLGLEPHVAFRD